MNLYCSACDLRTGAQFCAECQAETRPFEQRDPIDMLPQYQPVSFALLSEAVDDPNREQETIRLIESLRVPQLMRKQAC